ncbi:hypothetical protein LSTR_LSTR015490, partial [Laodelphax striatellus]
MLQRFTGAAGEAGQVDIGKPLTVESSSNSRPSCQPIQADCRRGPRTPRRHLGYGEEISGLAEAFHQTVERRLVGRGRTEAVSLGAMATRLAPPLVGAAGAAQQQSRAGHAPHPHLRHAAARHPAGHRHHAAARPPAAQPVRETAAAVAVALARASPGSSGLADRCGSRSAAVQNESQPAAAQLSHGAVSGHAALSHQYYGCLLYCARPLQMHLFAQLRRVASQLVAVGGQRGGDGRRRGRGSGSGASHSQRHHHPAAT